MLDGGRLRHYPPSPHLPSGLVMRIVEDRAARIWVASFTGLYRFDGRTWQRVGAQTGFPHAYADDVLLDSHGTLWVAAGNGLMYLPPGGARFVPTGVATGLYASLLETPGGALWGSDGVHGTRSLALAAPDRVWAPGFGHFASMRLDRQGALWGTDRRRGGVERLVLLATNPPGKNDIPLQPAFLERALKPVNDLADEEVLFFEPASALSRERARASHARIRQRPGVDAHIPARQAHFDRYFKAAGGFHADAGDRRGQLTRLALPILLVAGDHDTSTAGQNWFPLIGALRDTRFVFYSQTGHAPHHQYPEEVGELVTDFLRR